MQCSELQEGKEVAAQTRCEPSQKGSEESQSEARWTQRGQDRAQKGSDQQSRMDAEFVQA